MFKPASQKLTSWLITRPALFAITSFAFMLIVAVICSLTIGQLLPENIASPIAGVAVTMGFLAAIVMLVRGLPAQNLDRRSFVAINNLQTFVISLSFMATTLLIVTNYQQIMLRLLWLEANSAASFIAIMLAAGLFSMYLTGLFIANLYAKYRRVRAMGVPMWHIIYTIPFGFTMLWIPGYMLPGAPQKNPALPVHSGWYAKLTDWIIARPINTAMAFVVLILMSAFLFGFHATILTFTIAIAFAIWVMITGVKKFKDNIAHGYTWAATALNIISWIVVICITIYSAQHPAPMNITIDDTIISQETEQ